MPNILTIVALAVLAVVIVGIMSMLGNRAVVRAVHAVLPYNRKDATPPVSTSQAETFAARGDMAGAAHLFDQLLAQHGHDDALCRTVVDFHMGTSGMPERAEQLLRAMRRENPSRYEAYATGRLADLYLGPLKQPERARTELRRIAERFPGTREADGALAAIATLRAHGE